MAKLKYVGVWITNDINQYVNNNLVPLLFKLKQKGDIWSRLPLSVAGCCNLIKMIWLPQIPILFHNSPIWISQKWFKKIESLFRELIWKKGQSRISLQTMQLPIKEGGMAVTHPRSYFLASQLQHLAGCGALGGGKSSDRMMIMGVPHNILVEVLEADSFIYRCPTIKLVSKV